MTFCLICEKEIPQSYSKPNTSFFCDNCNQIDNMVCEYCNEPIRAGQDYTFVSEDKTVVEHTICLELRGNTP